MRGSDKACAFKWMSVHRMNAHGGSHYSSHAPDGLALDLLGQVLRDDLSCHALCVRGAPVGVCGKQVVFCCKDVCNSKHGVKLLSLCAIITGTQHTA